MNGQGVTVVIGFAPALLSLIIFTPWLGAALLALLRPSAPNARVIALLASASPLAFLAFAFESFDPALISPQFVERHTWIASLGVHYHLGLDALSLLLVLLTGIITPVAVLASWRVERSVALFGALLLALEGCALGAFLALDFVPWFLFWELSLAPAFFLIKLWGGPAAPRAAYQFVLYTLGGSAFLLLGFVALYAAAGTTDFAQLAAAASTGALDAKLASYGPLAPTLVFLGVLLGLTVKVPLWPLHTWMPATYAEAPTGVTIFLTGVLSKMGVYGLFRLLWPLFPAQLHAAATPLLWLALAGVVLGAFAAMRQTDLKRMFAYSSLNHLSYCLLALFAVAAPTREAHPLDPAATAAFAGALLQVFNHGLSAAALFACVGILETRTGGQRGLADLGGVRSAAPIFAGFCGIALFSSLGLPGLNGFVGEFLIFRGVFGLTPWAAVVACLGLFATAFFLLTFWQKVFHGPRAGAAVGEFRDLQPHEYATLLPLLVPMFVLGLAPQLLMWLINPLVTAWAAQLTRP